MNRPLPSIPVVRSRKPSKQKSGTTNGFSLENEGANLQQYLNLGPFIFLVLDTGGKLQFINQTGCETLGYSNTKEIIGKNWFNNFTPSGKRRIYRKIFCRVLENNLDLGARGHREGPTLRKDGSVTFIKWNYALAHDKKGKPTGIICYGEDVTGKKELEAKFLRAMMEGQDLERKRLATDMHDGLAVLLTGAKLNLEAINAGSSRMTEAKKKKLRDNSIALLTSALRELRAITLNLSPAALGDFGLVPALKDLCNRLNKAHQVSLKLRTSGITKALEPGIETGVYRIAQELIHNALKHSKAKKINVRLFRQDKILTLTVEDDGMGFNTTLLFDHAGRGLKNIRSRVKHLHGFFHIESFPQKGTIAMVEIPVR